MKSRGYNFLVRTMLISRLYDHQCGFKAFNRQRLCDLPAAVHDTRWFWDTEVLVFWQRAGYKAREIPIRWNEGPETTVKQSDGFAMGASV